MYTLLLAIEVEAGKCGVRKPEKWPGEGLLSSLYAGRILGLKSQTHLTFPNSPAHARAHQAMGFDKDTIANLQPHVIVPKLLKVMATWLTIGHLHRNIFFVLWRGTGK